MCACAYESVHVLACMRAEKIDYRKLKCVCVCKHNKKSLRLASSPGFHYCVRARILETCIHRTLINQIDRLPRIGRPEWPVPAEAAAATRDRRATR